MTNHHFFVELTQLSKVLEVANFRFLVNFIFLILIEFKNKSTQRVHISAKARNNK